MTQIANPFDPGLYGKIAIVTGGSKGIGRAIVELLAQCGATVAFIARDTGGDGIRLEQELQRQDYGALFIKADLTDDRAREGAVRNVIDTYSGIDILVNNAGHNDGVGLTGENATPEQFRQSMAINLTPYYDMTRLCWPYLRDSKGGIVNIGSKVSSTGQGGTSAYAAANGGIVALTREHALEGAKDPKNPVRVNCVVPAEVWNGHYKQWLETYFPDPEAQRAVIENKIPLGKRMTTPEEIAKAVVFLASNALSSHTTGQILYVDGGYTHLDRAFAHRTA